MSNIAKVEYRGVVRKLKPGHSVVLKCYKKKMLGSVKISSEPCEDGSIVPDGVKEITANDEYDVSVYEKANVQVLPDEEVGITPSEEVQTVDYDPAMKGIKKVTVSAIEVETVPPVTENKIVKASEGKYLKEVEVNVPVGATVSGVRDIDKNDTYDVTNFAKANVQVLPDEEVSVTPSEEVQTVDYNTAMKGIKKVTVGAIQASELTIGDGEVSFIELERRFSGELTPAEGSYYKKATVNIPLPDGYIKPLDEERVLSENDTVYDVTKDKKVTVSLPMQAEKEITPTETEQIVSFDTDENNYQGLSSVKVKAIEIYEPEEVTTPEATVTAPEGQYIKQLSVKVPTVAVYSGTAVPDASIGNDGDIYLLLEE